jgi:hypothetical protein
MTFADLRRLPQVRQRSTAAISLNQMGRQKCIEKHLPNSGNALSKRAKGCNQPPETLKTRMGELGGNVRISSKLCQPRFGEICENEHGGHF